MRSACHLLCLGLLLTACAEAGPSNGAPTRSPTVDYPPPPIQTSDGQVVGADGVSPDVKLKQGPTVSPGGVAPSDRPAKNETNAEPTPVPEDPLCKSLSMDDDAYKKRCKPSAAPRSAH